MTNAEFIEYLKKKIESAIETKDAKTVKVCSDALKIARRGGQGARRFRRDYERRLAKLPDSRRSS